MAARCGPQEAKVDKYYLFVESNGNRYVNVYGRDEAVGVFGAFDVALMEDGHAARHGGVQVWDMAACTMRHAITN